MNVSVLVAGLAITLLSSCTRDQADYQVPPSLVCDSIHVTYKGCIKPIFIANCYACHSDTASQGGTAGFDIENFTRLKTYLNYYYHNDSIYGSKFMRAINQQSGVLIMPPSYKLTDSDIVLIQYWLDRGAPAD